MGVIFITKNPFSSLSSLYNYCISAQPNMLSEHKDSIGNFIRNPIIVRDGGKPDSVEYYYSSPVDFWNSMNWNLESVVRCRGNAIHVQYEHLLDDPKLESEKIASFFKVERKAKEFSAPEAQMKNLGNNQHNSINFTWKKLFQHNTVKNHSYMELFSIYDREFIHKNLNKDLLERLSYSHLVENLVNISGN